MRAPNVLLVLAAVLIASPVVSSPALASSITGIWQQVDDESHDVRSLVQIEERGGIYEGKIIKVFPHADEPQNPICDQCTGAKKDAPYIGLKIIENVRNESGSFGGGTILDPEDGTQYNVKLTPSEDGKNLTVKGYIGIELIGRSQTWLRQK